MMHELAIEIITPLDDNICRSSIVVKLALSCSAAEAKQLTKPTELPSFDFRQQLFGYVPSGHALQCGGSGSRRPRLELFFFFTGMFITQRQYGPHARASHTRQNAHDCRPCKLFIVLGE